MGPQAIEEHLGRMQRYETVPRAAKGRLLDEVCEVTRYHRKAVIRLLRRPARPRRRRRGGRPEVVAVLRAIWTAAGYPWSVRLGTLLKHQIPLRTDRWDVQEPGFTEIDLVAHSGDRADGEFLHSLNVTDIHTLGRDPGGAGQGPTLRTGGARRDPAGVALPAARHRFG